MTLLPFIAVGLVFIILFLWLRKSYYRIRLTDQGITVFNRSEKQYHWDEIESLNGIDWPFMGDVVFSVKPKKGRRFYFLADKPSMSLKVILSGDKRTEMAKEIVTIKRIYKI